MGENYSNVYAPHFVELEILNNGLIGFQTQDLLKTLKLLQVCYGLCPFCININFIFSPPPC